MAFPRNHSGGKAVGSMSCCFWSTQRVNDTQKKMKCLIFILSPQFEMQMEVVFLFMACRIAWPDNKSQRKMEAPIANFMLKISGSRNGTKKSFVKCLQNLNLNLWPNGCLVRTWFPALHLRAYRQTFSETRYLLPKEQPKLLQKALRPHRMP